MGGPGSGRWGWYKGKTTVEVCRTLTVEVVLRHGIPSYGTLEWKHPLTGMLPEFGSQEFAAITRRDIKAVVARWIEVGKDKRSVPNYLRFLRAIFAWAIEDDIAHANPCLSPARIFKRIGTKLTSYSLKR